MPSAHRKAPPTQEVNPRPLAWVRVEVFRTDLHEFSAPADFVALTHIQSSEVHIKIWHQAEEHFSLCCNHDLWTFVIAGESYFAAALQGLARLAGLEKKQSGKVFHFFYSPHSMFLPLDSEGLKRKARIASSGSVCDSVISAWSPFMMKSWERNSAQALRDPPRFRRCSDERHALFHSLCAVAFLLQILHNGLSLSGCKGAHKGGEGGKKSPKNEIRNNGSNTRLWVRRGGKDVW